MDEEIVLCLPQDINKFCRTCMTLTVDILSQNIVLVEDDKPTLAAEMLESCTFAKIHADDELPKSICIECTQKLEIAYNYKLQCEQTDKNLREILNLTSDAPRKPKGSVGDPGSKPLAERGVALYENIAERNFIDPSVTFDEDSALTLEALVEDNRKSPVSFAACASSSQLEILALIEERKSAGCLGDAKETSAEGGLANGFPVEVKTELLSDDESFGDHLCNYCGASFPTSADHECDGTEHKVVLEKLLKLETGSVDTVHVYDEPDGFACKVCGVSFKSVQARNGHMATHGPSGDLAPVEGGSRCGLCGKTYANAAKLATHFQRHALDDKRESEPDDGHEPRYTIKCHVCRSTFRDELRLVKHMKRHGLQVALCKVCLRRFDSAAKLREHMKQHWPRPRYRCPMCEQHFASAAALKSHASVHARDTHDCTRCKRTFNNKFAFDKHMKQHTEPRFLCALCGKQYFSSVTLACHVRSHNNEKPFVCPFCAKGFSSRATLSVHKRIHSTFKPYVCSYCGYSCRQSGDLAMHVRTHTGVKPYKCTFPNCERKFTTSSQRKEHYRRHTNERNHKCPECQKAFLESKTLKVHMLTHTGEKPHCCDVCGKKFRRTHHLVNHMKGHK